MNIKLNLPVTLAITAVSVFFASPLPSASADQPNDASQQHIALSTPANRLKIACVGDSITAGTGSRLGNYPTDLAALLGSDYIVRNFGESGSTLMGSGDSPYMKRQGFPLSAEFGPDVVVIMLGTNDSKPFNWDKHKDDFRPDYKLFLDYYKDLPNHPQLYVCLPPHVVISRYGIREEPVEEQIPIIKEVAAEDGAKVIDVHDELSANPDDFADGVHPNDGGYVLLAESVYRGITDAPTIEPFANRRFYKQIDVSMMPPAAGVQIRYTTNGREPSLKSRVYSKPFTIKRPTLVKAQAFLDGKPYGLASEAQYQEMPLQSASTPPSNIAQGLNYDYYEEAITSVNQIQGKSDTLTTNNFNLNVRKRDTDFAIRFAGYVKVPEDGLYTFSLSSDDGSVLKIDDNVVVDNDGLHGVGAVFGAAALAAGYHKIELSYFQGQVDYALDVQWKTPTGTSFTAIPDSALYH